MNQQESRVCERVLQRFLITMRKVFECMAVFILARPFNAAKTWRRHDSARAAHMRPTTEHRWRDTSAKEVESACKPGSVRLAARQSFLSARRRRLAPATYPGTTRAALSFPYLVLLRVGFTVPYDVGPVRGALLPHPFTLTTHIRRCRSAVCSLLHWPSAHAAQELPGTLPCGARTFLDALIARRDCPADSVASVLGGSRE